MFGVISICARDKSQHSTHFLAISLEDASLNEFMVDSKMQIGIARDAVSVALSRKLNLLGINDSLDAIRSLKFLGVLHFAAPGLIYMVANNFTFLALKHMDSASFQVFAWNFVPTCVGLLIALFLFRECRFRPFSVSFYD